MKDLLIYAVVAIVLLGMVGVGVYKVKKWGADEVRAEWEEAKTVQREEEIQRSLKAATDLSADRVKRRAQIQERTVYVDRYIKEFVPAGTCFTPSGVSCINGSIDGKGADRCKPDGRVPAAAPAR